MDNNNNNKRIYNFDLQNRTVGDFCVFCFQSLKTDWQFHYKTKGLYNICQSDDLDLHSRSQLHNQTGHIFNL